jgi:hypothetical protein
MELYPRDRPRKQSSNGPIQPGRIRPSFGARDVVGEDFKTVRVEVDPVGALGLR